MTRADVIARLKAAEPRIRAHGVAALYLFGSYARDEASEDSDIDVFVDPENKTEFGVLRSMNTLAVLEEALPGIQIGYGTRENIVPVYLSSIEAAAIKIFG
jgi:predicted nucleotidyltransferase